MSLAIDEHAEPHRGPWTIADVEAMPEDGNRYEILSPGVLTVTPAAGTRHQRAARRIANAIEEGLVAAGASGEVIEAVDLEVSDGRLTVPDIVLVDAKAADREPSRYDPADVLLVVEVVSPGSKPMDREIKPELYADAGIPRYWRFEPHPRPHLIVHELRGERYEVAATIHEPATLAAPFPVEVDPARWIRSSLHR